MMDDLGQAKRAKRAAKRRALHTGLTIHKQIAHNLRTAYNNRLTRAKSHHFIKQISEAGNDSKAVQKLLNRAMHSERQAQLPDHVDPSMLANEFSDFFMTKVDKIIMNFKPVDMPASHQPETTARLGHLELASLDEIRKVILGSPSKSCGLNPIPSWLLKDSLDVVAPLIQSIVN